MQSATVEAAQESPRISDAILRFGEWYGRLVARIEREARTEGSVREREREQAGA